MATVGIFDSGSGGLSVLKELRKQLPSCRFIYYSDNANCPYGDKSPDFIIDRARSITELLVSKGAEAVVVACNTATAAAIATLREHYPIPFIGMEPAIKPAALGTRTGIIGVLATAGTLKGSLYLDTRGRFKDSVKIVEQVGRGFVELVESLELDGPHAEQVVRESLSPLLDSGADTIVLGCTHYPFLLPLMERIAAGRGIRFIDPAPAVARQLTHVMNERGISAASGTPGVELLASGSKSALERLSATV